MSCSVNLVPTVRLHARARTRRRNVWIVVCLATGLLMVGGWGIRRTAAGTLARLSDTIGTLEVQRTEVHRRLTAALAQRTQLLEQLETIAASRRPQPWARRLAALTRAAPEGVFLTAVNAATPGAELDPAAPARPRRRAAEPGAGAQAGDVAPAGQTVRLLGHALDHAALSQLLNTLQSLPGWQQVELVRATLEPFRDGFTVAFEIECRTQEDGP